MRRLPAVITVLLLPACTGFQQPTEAIEDRHAWGDNRAAVDIDFNFDGVNRHSQPRVTAPIVEAIAGPETAAAIEATRTNSAKNIVIVTGEHSETVQSGQWNRDDISAGDGVTITIQTGAAYDHEGDRTLYAFVHDFTFNAHGQLVTVSTERRITVDVAEAS